MLPSATPPLTPCPFCGGLATRVAEAGLGSVCGLCGAPSPSAGREPTAAFRQAVTDWRSAQKSLHNARISVVLRSLAVLMAVLIGLGVLAIKGATAAWWPVLMVLLLGASVLWSRRDRRRARAALEIARGHLLLERARAEIGPGVWQPGALATIVGIDAATAEQLLVKLAADGSLRLRVEDESALSFEASPRMSSLHTPPTEQAELAECSEADQAPRADASPRDEERS